MLNATIALHALPCEEASTLSKHTVASRLSLLALVTEGSRSRQDQQLACITAESPLRCKLICAHCRHEALEPGVEDALVASKLDALAAEYGHLLSSQLESQRAWYDARQAKAVAAAEAGCDSMTPGLSMRLLRLFANTTLY